MKTCTTVFLFLGLFCGHICATKKPKTRLNPNQFPRICGQQPQYKNQGRILGGVKASLGEFPWMALIIRKNRENLTTRGCGGFLIHREFVLTAAHCFDDSRYGPNYEVVLGEHDTSKSPDCKSKTKCADPPQRRKIRKFKIHPDYKTSLNYHNDIALVWIQKCNITDWVSPICLQNNKNHNSSQYFVSGWGRTSTGRSSDVKMKLKMPAFQHEKCAEMYSMIGKEISRDKQICAGGEQGKDSCSGDSGGPLMSQENGTFYADGLVSYGAECGLEGWPGIYTKVARFTQWIQNEMDKLKSNQKKQKKKQN